jgi:hypothetical protein
MDDDMAARLARMFPGDLVPSDELPDPHVPMRVRRQLMRGVRYEPPPSPVTAEKFRRVMESLPEPPSAPSAPQVCSVPTKAYLLENSAHVTRWLEEAKDLESDVKLGQPAEPHQVTRLLLEVIPVVEQHVSRP